MKRWPLFAVLAGLIPGVASSEEAQPVISPEEWSAYETRFVQEDGRVVDDANGDISHSEGQGYGMLLAYEAGNRPAFERIWSFTRTHLLLRDDGLTVWKWDPAAQPNVADPNNASDGDILISYALARAGADWGDAGFTTSATAIANALGRTSIYDNDGITLLRPGVVGFNRDDRPDGPVVNLSYWIFEAFPTLETLAPDYDWSGLAEGGKALVAATLSGTMSMPPDWLSVHDDPKPAEGFDPVFGYNALRIPLYLMRAGDVDLELLKTLRAGMAGPDGALALVDVTDGSSTEVLGDPGYRIIPALANCVIDGTRIPDDLLRFEPTAYYPSTLHLLALAHVREALPQCG